MFSRALSISLPALLSLQVACGPTDKSTIIDGGGIQPTDVDEDTPGGDQPDPESPSNGDSADPTDSGDSAAEDTGETPSEDTGETPSEDTGPHDTGEAPTEAPPMAADYSADGPWNTGVHTNSFDSEEDLEIWVDIWHPSIETSDDPVIYYGSPAWFMYGDGYRDLAADCTEPRPVMVHSHGSSSIRWEMFPLMEFMASHGWIVVAPDHAGNTIYGSWAPWTSLMERRPSDIRQTFDWLVEQSADPTSFLAGCVDESAGYVVSGYSLGGYTAYVVGGASISDDWGSTLPDLADERTTQIVTHATWDATGFVREGAADIEIPVLTIGGDRDATVGSAYRNLHSHVGSTPRALASFFDGGHFTPTPIYCLSWGDGCGPSYVDPDIYSSITKTSILAFLEHNRGYEGAWEQIVDDPAVVDWDLHLE